MMMKPLFAMVVCLLLASPTLAQSVRNGGSPATASPTGGLTATGGAFSLGGDSGNVVYTSPGGLQLGKSGTLGSITMGNATSGTIVLQPTTGALGSKTITFPATTGTIGNVAFLNVSANSGLLSSSGNLLLGDNNQIKYGAGILTLGTGTLPGGIFTQGPNANASGLTTDIFSNEFSCVGNNVLLPTSGFHDNVCIWDQQSVTQGDAIFSSLYYGTNSVKTTMQALLIQGTYLASGQRLLTGDQITCYGGKSDCAANTTFVYFYNGPIAGDEGEGFTDVNLLQQTLGALTLATITVVPTQSTVNTVTTQAIVGAKTVQTVTVVDNTGCNVGDWVIFAQQFASSQDTKTAMQITACGTNTISGIVRANYNNGIIATFGAITSGTCAGGGSTCDGTYTNVALAGGTGTLAKATIIIASGVVTSVSFIEPNSVQTPGKNYTAGDSLSATIATPGGSYTGFSVLVAATTGVTVTPALLIQMNTANQSGQGRWAVDLTQPTYTTGTVTSISGATFTGSGTTWTHNMVGGNDGNIGCIALDADTYTGAPFNGTPGTTLGPLKSWYQIISNDDPTHLTVNSPNTSGGGGYSGIGVGTIKTYTIAPCALIMNFGTITGQIVFESVGTPSAWAVSDAIEYAVVPYPYVVAYQHHIAVYTPGGTFAGFDDIENLGSTQGQYGLRISSQQPAGALETPAWLNALNIDFAVTALLVGNHVTGPAIKMVAGTNAGCATDLCSEILWGPEYIKTNTAIGGFEFQMVNSGSGLLQGINSTNVGGAAAIAELKWPGIFGNPPANFTTFPPCSTAGLSGAFANMLTNLANTPSNAGVTISANGTHATLAHCNELGNWTVMGM
jgi:hypothetical protein